jgi:hypothetical protein
VQVTNTSFPSASEAPIFLQERSRFGETVPNATSTSRGFVR